MRENNEKEQERQEEISVRRPYNVRERKIKEAAYRGMIRAELADELYDKIMNILIIEKKYKDPNYSARDLAKELNTNTRYLSAVINSRFGMNYSCLVNEYRIKEALHLLVDKRYADKNVEEISAMVGFSNRQSFYAAFYKKLPTDTGSGNAAHKWEWQAFERSRPRSIASPQRTQRNTEHGYFSRGDTSVSSVVKMEINDLRYTNMEETFNYTVEQFADLQILRYRVPGFEQLTLKQKVLIYYLSQAALEGRDILFDQNGKYNLQIRRLLEAIYLCYKGERTTEEFRRFEVYLKRVWFSNGIHHHYACDKLTPGFSPEYFMQLITSVPSSALPLAEGEDVQAMCHKLFPVIFNPDIMPKRVNQADGEDLLLTSAANYYEGVTQAEAEAFYAAQKAEGNPDEPVMYGMNSRLVKENGRIYEQVWKSGGMYSEAIEKIIGWLKKAENVAENDAQREVIRLLIDFYRTGDLHTFDAYSIAWLKDTASHVDFVNGFIESYGDPLGMKASWESIVDFKDTEATRRTETISGEAQWFEDHSPVDARFKKEAVKGVSAKVITAAILAGDLYPSTAIGINLPNSNWIRSVHGSKSVTIGTLTEAYNRAARGNGFREEFVYSEKELQFFF